MADHAAAAAASNDEASGEWQTGNEVCVCESEIQRLVQQCMEAVGAEATHAAQLAAMLVLADKRGHYSHGTNRLQMYVADVRTGATASSGRPRILRQTPATAFVDGRDLLGVVVGNYCMQLAIDKARQAGIAWVLAKNSSHFGITGHYAELAAASGMVGFCCTNTSPILFPTRAASAALGTNPIAVAAPSANDNDSFLLDMATSTVALGKIEICQRREEPLPSESWAVDTSGRATLSAEAAMDGGGVQPLGGSEASGGYKGYGLALAVELLCGVLANTAYGPSVRKWQLGSGQPGELAQCFVALDPRVFGEDADEGEGYAARVAKCLAEFRSLRPLDPDKPVIVPGDKERLAERLCQQRGGIVYHNNQLQHLTALAEQCGVTPPRPMTHLQFQT